MTENATRLDVMLLASSHHVDYSASALITDNGLSVFHDTSNSTFGKNTVILIHGTFVPGRNLDPKVPHLTGSCHEKVWCVLVLGLQHAFRAGAESYRAVQ